MEVGVVWRIIELKATHVVEVAGKATWEVVTELLGRYSHLVFQNKLLFPSSMAEVAIAKVEEVFERGPEQVEYHSIVVIFHAEPWAVSTDLHYRHQYHLRR